MMESRLFMYGLLEMYFYRKYNNGSIANDPCIQYYG